MILLRLILLNLLVCYIGLIDLHPGSQFVYYCSPGIERVFSAFGYMEYGDGEISPDGDA